MKFHRSLKLFPLLAGAVLSHALAEPGVELPHPLSLTDGSTIASTQEWEKVGRPATLELFHKHIYGRVKEGPNVQVRSHIASKDEKAMEGNATLKQIVIDYGTAASDESIDVTLFIPNHIEHPVAAFLLICNRGHESIDPTREVRTPFWPAEKIIEQGFAAAVFHYSDVAADDKAKAFDTGIFKVSKDATSARSADDGGTIAAWAWGASRVMDYLEEDPAIRADQVAVVGHSKGGKSALLAGAQDTRFALTISNNSGCGGAALSRRKEGETIADINGRFPHWFAKNFHQFGGNEHALPVDQHQLLALIAPRLVYVSSATQDAWADPEGEFLSCLHAEPVFDLYGLAGVGSKDQPQPEKPLHSGSIGYHLRTGKHDLTEYDWEQFMKFASQHWAGK